MLRKRQDGIRYPFAWLRIFLKSYAYLFIRLSKCVGGNLTLNHDWDVPWRFGLLLGIHPDQEIVDRLQHPCSWWRHQNPGSAWAEEKDAYYSVCSSKGTVTIGTTRDNHGCFYSCPRLLHKKKYKGNTHRKEGYQETNCSSSVSLISPKIWYVEYNLAVMYSVGVPISNFSS